MFFAENQSQLDGYFTFHLTSSQLFFHETNISVHNKPFSMHMKKLEASKDTQLEVTLRQRFTEEFASCWRIVEVVICVLKWAMLQSYGFVKGRTSQQRGTAVNSKKSNSRMQEIEQNDANYKQRQTDCF